MAGSVLADDHGATTAPARQAGDRAGPDSAAVGSRSMDRGKASAGPESQLLAAVPGQPAGARAAARLKGRPIDAVNHAVVRCYVLLR